MTSVPWNVVLDNVLAAGSAAGAMGALLIGLLGSTALAVVLGSDRTRVAPCRPALIALRRTPSDQRNAA